MENELKYKILNDLSSEYQKKLNQWRHDYQINTLGMSVLPASTFDGTLGDRVIILLTRVRKDT